MEVMSFICADRVLVGISERTTIAGTECLKKALQTVKADIRVDFVEFDGVLHLKSGLTELAPNVLIHDPQLKTDYALDWADVITLPTEEAMRQMLCLSMIRCFWQKVIQRL